MKRLHLSIVLLIAVAPILCATAGADSITLKNGGVIRGELCSDSKTADKKTTVAIRTHSGAIIAVDRGEVEFVSRSAPAVQRDSVKNNSIKKNSAKKVSARRRAAPVLLAVSDGSASTAEKGWFKRVKQWQGWLTGDYAQRQASARDQLKAIREADAVPALVHFFRDVPDEEQRLMYVEIMSQIEGDRPAVPLAVQAIVDESQGVRELAMRGVLHKDATKAIPVFLKALKHPLNPIVNRAGNALALVGDEKVLPQLIEALVTRHEYKELVLEKNEFTCNDQQFVRGVAVLPPQIAFMVATGQLPAPPEPEAVSPFIAPEVREVTVERHEDNPAVLDALVQLTGQSHGYDESAWRKWYHAGKNVRKKK